MPPHRAERSAFTVAVQAGAAQIKPRAYQVELLEMAKTNNVSRSPRRDKGSLQGHRMLVSGTAHVLTSNPRTPLPPTRRQVIAFLDTGAGKTFIAVMLLQHRLTASLSTHQATARAVFLVPRVPLVFQVMSGLWTIVNFKSWRCPSMIL